jgi:hypothetical protein
VDFARARGMSSALPVASKWACIVKASVVELNGILTALRARDLSIL